MTTDSHFPFENKVKYTVDILKFIKRDMGKQKTHSPIYYIKYDSQICIEF